MDFQTTISAILENRKAELLRLENEQKRISVIKAELEKISGSIKKLNDANNFSVQLESIKTAIGNLTEAEKKSKTLYNRFNRDSINIGMAGEARVGKSTILQTITGLSDEQIPTGVGEPVTAVHSRIFNIPAGEKPYALIQFHTPESFFEKRIKPYLTELNTELEKSGNEIQVNSFADFENYDFSKISVAPSDSDNLEKIKSAQEALHRYKNLLGTGETRIDDMSLLIKYVSYPRTEKGEKKNQDSVYWAVSNAEIYCHFPSLDNVKLGLLDLPGFGESTTVNDIQAAALKYDVDHTLWIFRPDTKSAFLRQVDLDYMKTVENVIKELGITSSKSFLSIAVNRDNTNEDFCKSLKETANTNIKKTWNEAEDNKNFRVYDIVAVDKDSAESVFLKALENLSNDIGKMDRDMLAEFKKNLDWRGIQDSLENVRNSLKSKKAPSDVVQIQTKADDLHENISVDFDDEKDNLRKSLYDSNDNFIEIVSEIKNKVSAEITEDLMFDISNYESWDDYVKRRKAVASGGLQGIREKEYDRLRIKILEAYEGLNDYYERKLEEIKSKIVDILKKHTGNFIEECDTPSKTIKSIKSKFEMSEKSSELSFFIAAFEWIDNIKLDFRSNVYPALISTSNQALDDGHDGILDILDPKKNVDVKDIADLKNLLQTRAKKLNNDLYEIISDNDLSSVFIYAMMERFCDILVHKNPEEIRKQFTALADEYREELWPGEYGAGNTNENALVKELKSNVRSLLETVSQINN